MKNSEALMMGDAHRYNELMVFDWIKAAKLIQQRKPKVAGAGLADDWEYTGGLIYEKGEIILDDYTFLASTWARPELSIDDVIIECFLMEHETVFNSHSKWPKEARMFLEQRLN